MKFLAAFVASASATAYTVCSYTQTFYPTADSDCSETATATSTTKVLVGVCSYDPSQTAWFKVTACSTVAVEHAWHNSAACSDTAATAQKTNFTAINTCVQTNKASSAVYSKIASLAGDSAAAVCGATITNWTPHTACTNADTSTATTFINRGMPAAGGVWIVGACYYMGVSGQYMKVATCTSATVWTVEFYTTTACASSAAGTPANGACNASSCTSACVLAYFGSGTHSLKIASVLHTHTVAQPAAPAAAAAAATTDGAKSLVAGSLAAVSMMYL